AGAALLALVYAVGHAVQPAYKPVAASGVDLDAFSKIPVSFDGRAMPLDSAARGSLKIISGRESIKPEDGERVQAIEWLADVLADNARADQHKVFRVDNQELKSLLGLPVEQKLFNRAQLMESKGNRDRLLEQRKQALKAPDDKRTSYQKAVLALYDNLSYYERLRKVPRLAAVAQDLADKKKGQELAAGVAQFMLFVPPDQRPQDRLAAFQEFAREADEAAKKGDRSGRLQMFSLFELDSCLNELGDPANVRMNLFFAAPTRADGEWQPLVRHVLALLDARLGEVREQAVAAGHADAGKALEAVRKQVADRNAGLAPPKDPGPLPPTLAGWYVMLDALAVADGGRAGEFNGAVAGYQDLLAKSAAPKALGTPRFERFFNRFDPFTIAIAFYIGAMLLGMGSWVGFSRPLVRGGLAFLVAALAISTFGLVARMYISGRPPVTNLYSSAVFIAWGAAGVCVVLELIYRNAIPTVAASVAGFASLLIAGALDVREADTMGKLVAVLDTNFWLATHVVMVTLGYVACFVAGIIAAAYVLLGVFTRVMDATARKEVARMVYGVVCFGMFASFVGTILGGIWADQSWGRFWGWDPKENGAILVVLWNAVILHARWGGLAKERGVMLLSVIGIVVTSWSWFGTNLMGVGLHSYGFIEGGQLVLVLNWLAWFAVVGIGLLPLARWRSYSAAGRDEPEIPLAAVATAAQRAAGGAVVATR
ncbi:MAG TPA: cytochrome c biogenesis protein CcsA, partial [Humisphaera sp.]